MTQPDPGLNSAPASDPTAAPKQLLSRWKGSAIAVLLSLLFPGLGQWRNRQPWRGFVMAGTFPALTMFAGYSRIFLSFRKMIAFFALTIFWRVLICTDAFQGARQGRESRKSFQQARVAYVILGALILTFAVTPSTDYFLRKFGYFRAFRVSSASMCPTICEGERIVADMDAYLKNLPRRGDVLLLDFHSEHRPLFIKRVVGIAGDVVSERNGMILVNGKPFREQSLSQVCGEPKHESSTRGEDPRFDPVTVPASSFFVVGDNSSNSYDSRIPGFGLATPDQIKGRPLHIYWSSERSRIGCDVR
jgi:signal peptidase I